MMQEALTNYYEERIRIQKMIEDITQRALHIYTEDKMTSA